jgi:predicted component of type VI protein secretion system
LLLTEESFHNVPPDLPYTWGQTYYPDGGFWAHALSDEAFAFTISGGPPHGKG